MTLALLALLFAQDDGWDKPVEIDKVQMALPWLMDAAGDRFITIQAGDKESFQTVVRSLAGKKICETALTTFEGPPAMLVVKDTLHTLFIGAGRKVFYRSMDLKTGKATEGVEVKIDGLDKAEDDIWPVIVEHGGAWYYAVCENGGKRLFIVESKDGGKGWSVISPPAWAASRLDGSRPLLASLGGKLHLWFANDEGMSHFTTEDGGTRWTGTVFEAKTAPMAVGTQGDRACLVYAEIGKSKSECTLRALTTVDAGKTWKKGGEIVQTGLDDPSALTHVSIDGDRVAFFGLGGKKNEMSGLAFLSADGGATWRDLEISKGMARNNVFYCGSFLPDGKGIAVAFLNVEGGEMFEWRGASYLLVRRYGKFPAPAALTDAEKARVREWVEQLVDDDLEVQEKAGLGLLKLGDRAIPFLRGLADAMKDGDGKARLLAIVKKQLPVWWKG